MIQHIVVENFKSLRKVALELGPMNFFIGTNASGKSNFFDALRLLQGIGNGFTIGEILDGKPKSATSEIWEGIRGGSSKACFSGGKEGSQISLEVTGSLPSDPSDSWRYTIAFSPAEARITRERLERRAKRLRFRNDGSPEMRTLNAGGTPVFDSDRVSSNSATDPSFAVCYYGGERGRTPHLKFERSRPVLAQFAKGDTRWKKADSELARAVANVLANTQRVDPHPAELRKYSQAHTIQRMGEHGENFAALIRTLCKDPGTKDAYLGWLRQLRPTEIDDVGTLSGAVGEPLFMLKEGGEEFPAPVLSDGTLRFAAITAAFFQPDMPGILTIEEIENGIHASRVRLLMELLRGRAQAGQPQVMATTHSPIVLAWLSQDEYRTTFFCKRDEVTGESRIQPLTDIPHFAEVVRRQPISDLFAEGWLEAAL